MKKIMILSAILLAGCGVQTVDKGPSSGPFLSSSWWSHVNRNQALIAVDKYFSGDSSASFFSCLAQNGVDAYIATYNSGLTGGTNVDTHLKKAQAAGLKLSAYFAFNSEDDLRSSTIDDFLKKIRPFPISTVWLDIETSARNIDELTGNWYEKVCKDAGYQCGVYTNYGGMSAASYPKTYQAPLDAMYLWFAIWDELPNPSYDVGSFYGWTNSHAKQFANGRLCNTEVDMNAFDASLFGGNAAMKIPAPNITPPGAAPAPSKQCQIGNLSGSAFAIVRSQPTRQSASLSKAKNGSAVSVSRMVQGEEIYDSDLGKSDSHWAELENGGYLNGLYVECK